jgi:hypothetical protein
MVVLVDAALFPGEGSGSVAVTVTAFTTVPVVVAESVIVTAALAPLAKLPRAHVIVPDDCAHEPTVEVAEPHETPAGITSISVTPVAALGPLLVTTTAYATFDPTAIGSGKSLIVTDTSAEPGFTVVLALAELFDGLGSLSFATTLAVFVSVPTASGVTTIVTVRIAPADMFPSPHVTVPLACAQVPEVGIADTKATAPGNTSVTVTPVTPSEPALVTVSV